MVATQSRARAPHCCTSAAHVSTLKAIFNTCPTLLTPSCVPSNLALLQAQAPPFRCPIAEVDAYRTPQLHLTGAAAAAAM